MQAERDDSSRTILLATLLAVAFCWALKLPTLSFLPREPDEIIYWNVAESLLRGDGYTLRSSPILEHLPPSIYDRPLFHHPPLFPLLLLPFVLLEAPRWAVLLSWLGHALCVAAVAIVAVALQRSGRRRVDGDWLWLALLAAATDPVLTFVSRKLWIDSLMTGLMSVSIALVWLALGHPRQRSLCLAAGVLLGLAGLCKLPALLGSLVILHLVWGSQQPAQRRLVSLLLVAAPSALLVAPWLVVFWSTFGRLTPDWLRPTEHSIANYPFIAAAVARPWYYYAVKLCIAQPLLPALLLLHPFRRRRDRDNERPAAAALHAPVIWILLWLAVPTLQGASGYGFQMRYVAPLLPAVFLLLITRSSLAARRPPTIAARLATLALLWSAMNSALFLYAPRYDELPTIVELVGWLRW